MAKRLNTIIIVPHSKANFIKFSFSTTTFFAVLGLSVLTLVLSCVAIAYTGSAVGRRNEVAHLKQSNEDLERVNRSLERTIAQVQGRLDDFEERTERLALAAGMDPNPVSAFSPSSNDGHVSTGGPYDRLPETPEILDARGDRVAEWLSDVEQALIDQNHRFASTPTIAPVVGPITDGFGRRRDPFTGRLAYHRGLDISGRRGTAIVAPADGVVVFAGRNGGMGRMIKISHGFGFLTAYGHLDKVLVEPGQEVTRGETIGQLGSTGRSTGPHLHYEVSLDGKSVNPMYYILDAF